MKWWRATYTRIHLLYPLIHYIWSNNSWTIGFSVLLGHVRCQWMCAQLFIKRRRRRRWRRRRWLQQITIITTMAKKILTAREKHLMFHWNLCHTTGCTKRLRRSKWSMIHTMNKQQISTLFTSEEKMPHNSDTNHFLNTYTVAKKAEECWQPHAFVLAYIRRVKVPLCRRHK